MHHFSALNRNQFEFLAEWIRCLFGFFNRENCCVYTKNNFFQVDRSQKWFLNGTNGLVQTAQCFGAKYVHCDALHRKKTNFDWFSKNIHFLISNKEKKNKEKNPKNHKKGNRFVPLIWKIWMCINAKTVFQKITSCGTTHWYSLFCHLAPVSHCLR